MDDNRGERCQSRHQLQHCKLQRTEIGRQYSGPISRSIMRERKKEHDFISQFPANVTRARLPDPLSSDPASAPAPASASAQALTHVHARAPTQLHATVYNSTDSALQSTPSDSTQPTALLNSHLFFGTGMASHPGAMLSPRNGPNVRAFPVPSLKLPAVQRLAHPANQFNENTKTVQAVPANANSSKSAPADYVTSNSLRRNYGTSGRRIRVITNYVVVKQAPEKLFVYSIICSFAKDDEEKLVSKDLKDVRGSDARRIVDSLQTVQPLISANNWSTRNNEIWTVGKLFHEEQFFITNLTYTKPNGRSETIPLVALNLNGVLDLSRGHLDILEGGKTTTGTDVSKKTRALNAFISRFMCCSTSTPIQHIGANRFFLTDAYSDMGPDSPFVTIRGYYSSIRPGNDRILLNVNTTTSAFFKPMLVSTFFEIMRQHRIQDWLIIGMLNKKIVRITYDRFIEEINREESRRRVVAGFGLTPSNQTFSTCDGGMTVYDYFKTSDGCPLKKDSNVPCVNIGGVLPGREQWVPAELLEIDYPQPCNAILPPVFTDRMMKAALRTPAQNANLIVNEGLVHLGIKKGNTASATAGTRVLSQEEIGLDVDDKLVNVPARILDQPTLRYGAIKGKPQTVQPKGASWRLVDQKMRKQPFAVPSTLPRMGILTLGHSEVSAQDLSRVLARILCDHDIRVADMQQTWHRIVSPRPDSEGSYLASVRKIISDLDSEMRKNRITVVLLPDKGADLYSAIKTVCDTRGILTICSASPPKKLLPEQTLSNIALKFSMKTGGRPHQVEGALHAVGTDTMIMGADVTHPTSGAAPHCPSISAAVASMDEHALNYFGSMRLQKSRQEFIEHTEEMTLELLNMYGRKNKRLPANIVFYRDGVSESQYDSVRDKEVMAIEKAWMALKQSEKPSSVSKVRITCVVVGKRHNTRFYPMQKKDEDRSTNIMPGLVVDSVITHPYCFDFFLQSHAAIKGTARSAHYFLIRNDIKLNEEQIQALTHSLCFAYGTATKGISYCAPAYHADRLCERGRCYIRDWLLGRPGPSSLITKYRRGLGIDIKEFERREARRLNHSRPYNVWETAEAGKFRGRMNPWHPSLNDKMFWV